MQATGRSGHVPCVVKSCLVNVDVLFGILTAYSNSISLLTTFARVLLLGPVLVTRDAIPDPQVLGIKAIYNGSTVQDGNTKYVHLLTYLSLSIFPYLPLLSPS